jgi:hypothetical protein
VSSEQAHGWPPVGFISPSFPNSCLGTPSPETPFRSLSGGETEFRKTAVPKQEFGNQKNQKKSWSA